MRVPSAISRGEVGINLTPMIDVTFQLIIFFLVSSHLSKQEAHMQMPLPVADSGEASEETSKRLTLNVLSDGSLLLAGHRLSPGELPGRLREAVANESQDLEIRIRGDRSVTYQHVEPVLIACARSGVWNVKFSVYRPEDVR